MQPTRCAARRDFTATAELCPNRDDCERHRLFTLHGPGDQPAPLWMCQTAEFEARMPRPCAGKGTRISPTRPHPLCRSGCARWQFGIPDGITPEFIDQDGTASCADRVVFMHLGKVGAAAASCAPTR